MINEITDSTIYSNFLKEAKEYNFLQSWEWGNFQESIGNTVNRYGVYKDENLIGIFTIFEEKTKLCRLGIIQYGPIFKDSSKESYEVFLKDIKNISKKKYDILRIGGPILNDQNEIIDIFNTNGFKSTTGKIFADYTSKLDITDDDEKLLLNMRKTTRYLIRQKEKFKIEIEKSNREEDVKLYCDIEKDTVAKHRFNPYPYSRILKEFKTFSPDHMMIFKAKYEGKVISMAIVMFYEKEADYLYGASLSEYTNIPASYVIQWEAIKEAKSRGCSVYNFWGISDEFKVKNGKKVKHPWWGLSQFKRGFGGTDIKYYPGFDLVLSLRGYAQTLLEIYRKAK